MKIKLVVVGKTKLHYLAEGEADYNKRLKHYCQLEEILITDIKNSSKLSQKELKKKESKMILRNLMSNDYVVILDENGDDYSSIEFSEFLKRKILNSTKTIIFIIGGAFGLSDEIYARANNKLRLSKMTFSHQMVRLIFKEQLYRAFTIQKGEKYHHN
ncbi:MAG: 23S rRNA (pseudouridine(1915)-N(3))-methyltransferase RlmH [Crocinitomicaceae bacterium]|nr:23S rRNA (pseudouridine(1915)-N(3))-methyltransferase RlmH [Crocinitomicaceae bacterium]|tara:strand:+ start:1778 stop:2251 length:474 start_codon:yes stop_codon:yes gene_type:complete